jgi:hypothetical protein
LRANQRRLVRVFLKTQNFLLLLVIAGTKDTEVKEDNNKEVLAPPFLIDSNKG